MKSRAHWFGKGSLMMKNIRRWIAVLLVCLMMVSLAACGAQKGEDGDQQKNDAQSQVKDGQTVYPCTLTSGDGSKVILEAEPEKIVSISPTLTEMLYGLEAGDKLIGRSDYCDYPQEVAEVESVGSIQTADMEKIVSLDPDLVLMSSMADDDFMEKLSSLGIPVLIIQEVTKVEQVYDAVTMMGLAVNRNAQAEAGIEQMKNTIGEVQNKIAGQEAPSVYYVVGYGETGDYTAGGDTFVGDILTLAGGDNIAKNISGWSITLEEIIESDPDIILLPEYYRDEFVKAPHYCELTAVKEDHVYVVDNNTLERQGFRNAEAIRTLAELFHPEAFK